VVNSTVIMASEDDLLEGNKCYVYLSVKNKTHRAAMFYVILFQLYGKICIKAGN
jgi:hypothetical protein